MPVPMQNTPCRNLHKRASYKRTMRGFTLVEILATLAIVGVLTTLAVSYSGDWRKRVVLNMTTRNVFRILSVARTEAIKRGRTTTVLITDTTVYGFVDINNNQAFDANSDELLQSGDQTRYTLDTNHTITTSTEQAQTDGGIIITFDFEGLCKDPTGEPMGASLSIADSQLSFTHTVETTIAGAIRVVKYE